MLKVGINENVILKNVELQQSVNGKPFVSLVFGEGSSSSLFDEIAGDGEVATGNKDSSIKIWGLQVPSNERNGVTITPDFIANETIKSIAEMKNTFHQILSCYTTSDKIKFAAYTGLDITETNQKVKVVQPEILHIIFTNMVQQFIAQVQPFLNDSDSPVRLLLIRQNKKVHYPMLRKTFVKDNPFIESAAIPKEASKLKFTKWEMDNGYDNPEPTSKSEADVIPSAISADDLLDVFGGDSAQ